MKTTKPFRVDAVEMVRQIRDEHAAQLEGKSPDERLAFYREEGAKAQARLAELARRTGNGTRQAA